MNPQKHINNFFIGLEKKGLIKRTPGILFNYEADYPYFKELEENHEIIKKECESLLSIKNEIHDVEGMGGSQTKGGIHSLEWKSFMFKAGSFVEENCQLCPETAKILKRIPRIKQAFFSILYPNQYIKPHRGYYQGFLRYHMGVIIPNNNRNNKCWLRVNDNLIDNQNYDKTSLDRGEVYHWKNGEGIVFNDNYLHDASNETDEIRVVLWIDVLREFPKWLDWINRMLLNIAYRTDKAKGILKEAKVNVSPEIIQKHKNR